MPDGIFRWKFVRKRRRAPRPALTRGSLPGEGRQEGPRSSYGSWSAGRLDIMHRAGSKRGSCLLLRETRTLCPSTQSRKPPAAEIASSSRSRSLVLAPRTRSIRPSAWQCSRRSRKSSRSTYRTSLLLLYLTIKNTRVHHDSMTADGIEFPLRCIDAQLPAICLAHNWFLSAIMPPWH